MARTKRHGDLVQRREHGRGEGAVAGKTTLAGSLPAAAASLQEVAAPSAGWPAATSYVSEEVARAHGLVPFDPSIPVQRLSAEAHELSSAAHQAAGGVQAVAEGGFSGGGAPLPHLDAIQAAFGRHDISGVQAHVGGAAADAARAVSWGPLGLTRPHGPFGSNAASNAS